METSGKAFVSHWEWAAEKGLMNPNTAHTYRAACLQILSSVFPEDWEDIDVNTLDAEDLFLRFQNLRGKELRPRSLQDYRRRLDQALVSFRNYATDPSGWKAPRRDRSGRQELVSPRRSERAPSQSTNRAADESLIEYPFPVREGLTARLHLPRDLRVNEAKRLTAFVMSLAVDSLDPIALPAPSFSRRDD
jgi:hypothetical protein